MPIGIRAISDQMAAIVDKVEPKTESRNRFNLAESDTMAWTPDIWANPGRAEFRNFVIRPTAPPVDNGEAGTPAGRLMVPMAVRIVYPYRSINKGRLWDMMSEDAALIQRAMQVVTDWDRPNTGIMSISPATNVDYEELDQGDKEAALGLTIPFEVIYRENPL